MMFYSFFNFIPYQPSQHREALATQEPYNNLIIQSWSSQAINIFTILVYWAKGADFRIRSTYLLLTKVSLLTLINADPNLTPTFFYNGHNYVSYPNWLLAKATWLWQEEGGRTCHVSLIVRLNKSANNP